MANERSLSWMTKEPEEWDKDVDYYIFQDFVNKIRKIYKICLYIEPIYHIRKM